mgnify:CR=1 FL=1
MVGSGLAVECYVCESVVDNQCLDHSDSGDAEGSVNSHYTAPNNHIVDCGDNVTSCTKTKLSGKWLQFDFIAG